MDGFYCNRTNLGTNENQLLPVLSCPRLRMNNDAELESNTRPFYNPCCSQQLIVNCSPSTMNKLWVTACAFFLAAVRINDGYSFSDSSDCAVESVADGECDSGNNIAECAYDGGDCCECSCFGDCSSFDCMDPSAPRSAFGCLDAPDFLPCQTGLVSLVVRDSATASDLARAANCSGGAFNVEWIGHIEFPETIFVANDTFMNITGTGAGSTADGAADKRFLVVFDAEVHVEGLQVENCATSSSGGAIYAERSKLSFTGTAWSNNTAGIDGGAVYVYDSSGVSWSGETTWSDNNAGDDGGAVYVLNTANVSWSGESAWSGNTARDNGGAVFVYQSSGVSWSGHAAWSNNVADADGGAVFVYGTSNLSWSGDTTWSDNTAGDDGGAVYVHESSRVSWSGHAAWSNNTGDSDGGAIYVYDTSGLSWSGDTTWTHNTAGGNGGAVLVYGSSSVSWIGNTTWSHNTATGDGGEVYVSGSSGVSWKGANTWHDNVAAGSFGGAVLIEYCSGVSWSGETLWMNNTAGRYGGAVNVFTSSVVSWSGNTTWAYNTVGGGSDIGGGAISVSHVQSALWSGETMWSHNIAIDGSGGAVYVDDSLDLSWDGVNTWSHNTALGGSGGAVFLRPFQEEISGISWSGENTWSHNTATDDGGAVCVLDTTGVYWSGNATWLNNSATSGGAIYLLRSAVLMSDTFYFQSNTANGAGGAIMLSGVDDTVFHRTRFTANSSPRGGAVYSVSSGIKTDNAGAQPAFFPIVYEDCLFTGNWASASGGAIESLVGYDQAFRTVFERNTAGVGGALRLGGAASLTNCTFVDNISDEDEFAAISNLGVLQVYESRFSGNSFWCEDGTYLGSGDGDGYAKACDGCDEFSTCGVQNEGKVPICFEQVEHTRSEGGNTTLETLEVNAGYWRAVNTSPHTLPCYNEGACRGGLTSSSEFCKEGYEGPCK